MPRLLAFDRHPCIVSQIRHITELNVDRKGIEGAAVTIVAGDGDSGPDGYEEVYSDFTVDRSFGFVITYYDNILFIGEVNEAK